MSRLARLLRKHRRLMRWIATEEAILGRPMRLSRSIAARQLHWTMSNVRSQRWQ